MGTEAAAPRLRPLRIGEVLDVAIKIYGRHFWTLFRVVFFVVAPLQVFDAIVKISTIDDPRLAGQARFSSSSGTGVYHQHLGTYFAGQGIILILSLIVTPLVTGAGFKAVSDGYLGGTTDWRVSLLFAWKRLRSLIWLSILTGILLVLAFIALIVPGVYFTIAWTVAVPVLLLEDRRGASALGRSRQLVRGRWWPTAGALVVTYVLLSVASGAVSGLLVGVALSGNHSVALASILSSVAAIISTSLAKPFQVAVIAVIYFDLRVRKEGFDLQLLADRIGGTTYAHGGIPEPPAPSAPPPGGGAAQPPYWPPPPGWQPPAAAPPPPPPPPPPSAPPTPE